MDDLISRQAAIEALGEEPEVWSDKYEYDLGLRAQWRYDRKAIIAVQSAQREIVLCKDCKHRPIKHGDFVDAPKGNDGFDDEICPCLCEDCYYNWMPEDDFFCKRGERREDVSNC